MFKPLLVIPGVESIKVDKNLFDTLVRQMTLTPINKQSVLDIHQNTANALQANAMLLMDDKITPREAHNAYIHEIYSAFIVQQLEQYAEVCTKDWEARNL